MKKPLAMKVVSTCLILLVLSVLAGCSSSADSSGASGGDTKAAPFVIRYAHSATGGSPLTYLVAHELGFDAEENLEFVDVGVISANEQVASVVADQIDVGSYHINRMIAGIGAGAKVKAVSATSETTEDIPHMVFVTLEDSPIYTAQDFNGIKLGLGSYGGCNEGITYAWLLKNGITNPKEFAEIVVLPSEAKQLQALEQGDVDAIGIHKDLVWLAARGGLRVIYSDYDVWGTLGGSTPSYFSVKFIEAHPEEIRRFCKVMSKTINWINASEENSDRARQITANLFNTELTEVSKRYFAPNAIIKQETVQVWLDLLTEFGEIPPGITAEDVFTNEYSEYYQKS
jgi:ABC-type nitrate/sulfonate/bicarbonate transport system substrate-binding protein